MKKNSLVPVVSSQHGATITLLVSSLIPVLISSSFSFSQAFTVLFLFSGFMFVEILQGSVRRGGWKNAREKYWNFIYGALLVSGCLYQWGYNSLFRDILPFLVLTGALSAGFIFFKLERLVLTQFIVFSLFSMAGLLTFPEGQAPEPQALFILWAVESLYFGLSTFTVKFRMGGIREVSIVIYLVISMILLGLILPSGLFKVLFILLLALKILTPLLAKDWFRGIRLKKIGLFEFASSVIFLFLTGFLFDSGLG